MAIRRIKVSELTPATSLAGYYALGYKVAEGKGTSVRLDLGYVQAAYESTVKATDNAREATGLANDAANEVREEMTRISGEAGKAIGYANKAAESAEDTAGHPTYVGPDHYAYRWDKEGRAYARTGVYCKGDTGEPGKDFRVLGYYGTVAALRAAVTSPRPGDAYGVGVSAPYPIHIWDAVSGDWRDNGTIQGPEGRPGKSARIDRETGFWREYDDAAQSWVETDYVSRYVAATPGSDGLMSKEDKAALDRISSDGAGVSREAVERVLTGEVTSHGHGRVTAPAVRPTDTWDGVTVSTSLEGSGTPGDPWLVRSCADFLHMNVEGARYGADISQPVDPGATLPRFHARITHDLDFGGHGYAYPVFSTMDEGDAPFMGSLLCLAEIDGQGMTLRNLSVRNNFSPFLNLCYCHVHGINIRDCEFEIELGAEMVTTYSILGSKCPMCDYNFSYDCSCRSTFRTVRQGSLDGDYTVSVTGVSGTDPANGRAGAYHGDNTFLNAADVSGAQVRIMYTPVNPGLTPGLAGGVRAYDLTATTGDPGRATGFLVLLMDPGNGSTVYYDSDAASASGGGDSPSYVGKTAAELKSPGFLALLNGGSEVFREDTGSENGGFPVLRPAPAERVVYDGYVGNKEFEDYRRGVPVRTDGDGTRCLFDDGSYKAVQEGCVYRLNLDLTGDICRLDAQAQRDMFGASFPARATKDNVVSLLGGREGVRGLASRLSSRRDTIVTLPILALYYPAYMASASVISAIITPDGQRVATALADGHEWMFFARFYISAGEQYHLSLHVSRFNTPAETVSLAFECARPSPVIRLGQAEYDATPSKDGSVLYACVQDDGSIIMR